MNTAMSMFDKLRDGAQRAGVRAVALAREGSTRVASGSRDFVQGFTLPGEAEKAAKILASFLGQYPLAIGSTHPSHARTTADPNHPESALNSIPKAVLQRARGTSTPTPYHDPTQPPIQQGSPSSKSSKPDSCSPEKPGPVSSSPASQTAPGPLHRASPRAASDGASKLGRTLPTL